MCIDICFSVNISTIKNTLKMENEEINFNKYLKRGAYHWSQISKNPLKRNTYVLSRYKNICKLIPRNSKLQQVLDAGCGDGVLIDFLSKTKNYNVYGIDNSDEAISFAKKRLNRNNVELVVGDVYKLPYPDDFFDIICSTEVIEHLNYPEKFLEELSRVSKKGSTVIITTPIKNTKFPVDKMHYQEWFVEDYKELINNYFEKTTFKYSHPIVWRDIYISKFRYRFLFNLFSLIGVNIFSGFNSIFVTKSLQYSISKK